MANDPENEDTNTPDGGIQLPGGRLSRRRMLQAMGVAGGAGALAASGVGWAAAAVFPGAPARPAVGPRTGTIKDLKHVVVMMQENRSFDHYHGTSSLPGIAGYGDKQIMEFQNGQSLLYQPNSSYPEGYQLPYRLDDTKWNTQNNNGQTMGYFAEEDVPWQRAISRAYTTGDHYHCALLTSTDPNRIMMWTGTNDPQGGQGGPRINNDDNGDFLFTWQTYPEVLQDAGVSWRIYVNNNNANYPFFGDFQDNLLRDFAVYNPANANAENTVPREGLLWRAGVLQTNTTPPADQPDSTGNLDYVLQDFISDCEAGIIPEISWIVGPAAYSEHPNYAPNNGAVYVNRVIQALHSNPELWDSTLLVINYDEANGYGLFDHILHPVPEVGTPDERAPGLMPGFGLRVPLVLVSPWTRGGWVAKETFDHTSVIQFMEQFTTHSLGKPALCTEISAWRRSISGDFLSAIDFTSFDNSLPELPVPAELEAVVIADESLPAAPEPAPGTQVVPVQSNPGQPKLRLAPYQQHVTIAVDRSTGGVTATLTNDSVKAASMQTFSGNALAAPFYYPSDTGSIGTPNTVSSATGPKTYSVDTTTSNGQYDISTYGPDHFVRRFTGTVIPAGQNSAAVPVVNASLEPGSTKILKIQLGNEGQQSVQYTLTPNDYAGSQKTVTVGAGRNVSVDWPTDEYGYYDVSVAAATTPTFTYRYAGHIS